jgi:hypothetical protein
VSLGRLGEVPWYDLPDRGPGEAPEYEDEDCDEPNEGDEDETEDC